MKRFTIDTLALSLLKKRLLEMINVMEHREIKLFKTIRTIEKFLPLGLCVHVKNVEKFMPIRLYHLRIIPNSRAQQNKVLF